MGPRVVYREKLPPGRDRASPRTATCLIDLGLPCHLACTACWRTGAPNLGGLSAARSHLLAAARSAPPGRVRAVFFGGDVFTAPHAFTALVADAAAACEEHGRALESLVLSDGVDWSDAVVRDLGRHGVRLVQVTLEGSSPLHDRLRPLASGGGSFACILESLVQHRDALPVVVRMNASADDEEVGRLVDVLEREGLFAGPNPVLLYVAPPAPYREQVLDLLELVEREPTATLSAGVHA
jgi:uncharacterized protein